MNWPFLTLTLTHTLHFFLGSAFPHPLSILLVVMLLTLDEDYMARLETVSIKLNYCFIVGLISVGTRMWIAS